MTSHVLTAAVVGLDAHPVDVEADVSPGLPNFSIVGLPDAAVIEAKERIRSALRHTGLALPKTRVTVNLAPGTLKKVGTLYDVPIALAVLHADGVLSEAFPTDTLIAGELTLEGMIRPIQGALSLALLARERGCREIIVPEENAAEAALAEGIDVRAASHLGAVLQHLRSTRKLPLITRTDIQEDSSATFVSGHDFSAIRGQEQARRALEIAAAGAHNVLMQGPPGSGKTLLARTFSSILPPFTREELLEATRVHSVAGLLLNERILRARPFRAPHHSASATSLIGGGSVPRPGEVSLAHRGVLFLDEFLEFPRTVLEGLRQPLEDGFVTVSRAQGTVRFPARFLLLAAMNPCPCGFSTDPDQACVCSNWQRDKYYRRLSGPLLDRIDLCLDVPKIKTNELLSLEPAEDSETIRRRVQAARERQIERAKTLGVLTNAELRSEHLRTALKIAPEARTVIACAIERYHLSGRAYSRTLKVAQTIADLAGEDTILASHVAEALLYRKPAGTTHKD